MIKYFSSLFAALTPASKRSRYNLWKDITIGDAKMFLAYILMMGVIKKPYLAMYWSTDPNLATPFFSKYIARDRFLLILSMFHLNDEKQFTEVESKKPKEEQDRLFKLRPLVDLLSKTFLLYKPTKELALDEGGCPWKGRLSIKVYCPMKPNRFSIKTFQVCEATSGYTMAFEVYTGKSADFGDGDDEEDTRKTTKLVMYMMEKAGCLDKGHHLYMDNYYNSPELCEALSEKLTPCCGTLNTGRDGVPQVVKATKKAFKKKNRGECVWRRKGDILILCWQDKKPVTTISTIHAARMKNLKRNFNQEMIKKPESIVEYNKYMYGVDLGDQLLVNCTPLRKTMKWWRKLTFHFVNMALVNSWVLYKKYQHHAENPDANAPKITHTQFTVEIVDALVKEARDDMSVTPIPKTPFKVDDKERQEGFHFPIQNETTKPNAKRAKPARPCKLCNFRGVPGYSCYRCEKCKVTLHIECFKAWHSVERIDRETVKKYFEDADDAEK